MPVQRVVVEAHFGVEREEITALGEDQRIDLDHRGVGLDERLVDGVEELGQLAGRCPAQPHTERELAALEGDDAGSGVDVLAENLLRFLRRDLFDVHAAGGTRDDDGRRGCAVDQDAQIELALDIEPFLDEHAADLLALRAGLMRDQRHADYLLRQLLHLLDRPGDLDAAALTAAAGMNLCLHDGNLRHRAAWRHRRLRPV